MNQTECERLRSANAELLAALEAVHAAWLRESGLGGIMDEEVIVDDPLLKQVRAAIAHAYGTPRIRIVE